MQFICHHCCPIFCERINGRFRLSGGGIGCNGGCIGRSRIRRRGRGVGIPRGSLAVRLPRMVVVGLFLFVFLFGFGRGCIEQRGDGDG